MCALKLVGGIDLKCVTMSSLLRVLEVEIVEIGWFEWRLTSNIFDLNVPGCSDIHYSQCMNK